jgi:hypothetical protein
MSSIIEKLENEGCEAYVKTIYVGFDLAGEMVAAAYGHARHVEIAIALPEDHPDTRLQDATHLTWRTLPVSLDLTTASDVQEAAALLKDACDRVRQGAHDVNRDNDHFIKARQRRKASRGL